MYITLGLHKPEKKTDGRYLAHKKQRKATLRLYQMDFIKVT